MALPVFSVHLFDRGGGSTGVDLIYLFTASFANRWELRDCSLTLDGALATDAMALEYLSADGTARVVLALLPDPLTNSAIAHWQGRLVLAGGDQLRLSFATAGPVTYGAVGTGYQFVIS